MDLSNCDNFRDWLPGRCYRRDERTLIDWCYMGKERLTEPFFEDSINKRLRRPFNVLFRHQTPIEFLGDLEAHSVGVKPSGFIFHLSRCGSTLVSQMLAALEQNIVVSEAPPIDFVIRSHRVADQVRARWLRWMINAFGQRRSGRERHLFIKFDSWNMLDFNLVRRAFPDVPWIFLYRNPVEIIVSHLRQRGVQMIPGTIPEILPGLSFEEAMRIPAEEYCARVLGTICRGALDALRGGGVGLAVDYRELPGALEAKILSHFGVRFSAAERAVMLEAARHNAKHPRLQFSADSEQKKREAGASAVASADEFVNSFYAELEEIRINASNRRL